MLEVSIAEKIATLRSLYDREVEELGLTRGALVIGQMLFELHQKSDSESK